jgi:prepilin-type N-terminal cleavage/methylation domain-containing protein
MTSKAAFSLLELLVAVALLGILTAGMARAFLGGLQASVRVNDTLAAQRTLRWSLEMIADDLRMLGYLFPPRPLPVAASADPGRQSALMVIPEQPIKKERAGVFAPLAAAEDPFEPADRRVDELSFVSDRPLEVRGWLAAPTPGPEAAEAPLVIRAERKLRLEAGDLLVIEDTPVATSQVLARVDLRGTGGEPVRVRPAPGEHRAGCRVRFLRPLRVVRFAVVALPLEGAGRPLVPCLMRFEAGYPADQSVPAWAGLVRRGSARAVIIAEQVTGFQVDLSLDGRWPGVRGRDYPDTIARLNRGLEARYGPAAGATDPLRPFWFRRFPVLLRLRLEVRAPLARFQDPKSGGRPGRWHHHDALTLILAPRNAGLERP